MSKMAELHYEREQEMQEDLPEIEYHSKYEYIGIWTPTLEIGIIRSMQILEIINLNGVNM